MVIESQSSHASPGDDRLRGLQVEVTNICNFQCVMCVRRAWSGEAYRHMSPRLFRRIMDEAPETIRRLALYGFGEPFMHPDFIDLVRYARETHPDAHILTITNGSLVDEDRARRVFEAGLDELIFSIDAVDLVKLGWIRVGSSRYDIIGNLARTARIARSMGKEVGISVVIMRSNFAEIAAIVSRALELGVSSITFTHVVPYYPQMVREGIYSLASRPVVEKVKSLGLDRYRKILYNAARGVLATAHGPDERGYYYEYLRIAEEIHSMGYSINVDNVSRALEMEDDFKKLQALFNEALRRAKENGVRLSLPRIYADANERSCPYIDGSYMFIRSDGLVAPCMDFAYDHPLYVNGHRKIVRRVILGDLNREKLLDVWHKKEYVEFRRLRRNFTANVPWCGDCPLSTKGCWYTIENQYDCYGGLVGCNECLYSAGLAKCII